MPALVSLTQEELDALAAEQAAQDAAATAPVPPPYDPAQDTQGMQAQPAAIAVAPPAPYVDPATSADASRATGYDVAPAPVYQEVAPPQEYTTQTIAPAPVAEPTNSAPYTAVGQSDPETAIAQGAPVSGPTTQQTIYAPVTEPKAGAVASGVLVPLPTKTPFSPSLDAVPNYDYGPTSRVVPIPNYDYGPTSRVMPLPTPTPSAPSLNANRVQQRPSNGSAGYGPAFGPRAYSFIDPTAPMSLQGIFASDYRPTPVAPRSQPPVEGAYPIGGPLQGSVSDYRPNRSVFPVAPPPETDALASYRARQRQEQQRQQQAQPAILPPPYASPSTDTYQTPLNAPTYQTRNAMAGWNSLLTGSAPPDMGEPVGFGVGSEGVGLTALGGSGRGVATDPGVALGLPYLGLWDAPLAPDVGLPSGGGPYRVVETRPGVQRVITREGGVTLPIKGEASTGARPAQYGPGLRPSGGMSADNPGYVGIRPRVEPDIIPEPAPANAPVPKQPVIHPEDYAPPSGFNAAFGDDLAGALLKGAEKRGAPPPAPPRILSRGGEWTWVAPGTEVGGDTGRWLRNGRGTEPMPTQPPEPATGEAGFQRTVADQATRIPVSEPRPISPGEGTAPATTPSGQPAPRRTPVEATAPVPEPTTKPTAPPADPTRIQHEGNWAWNPTEKKWYDTDMTVTPPAPTGQAAAPVQRPVLEARTVTPAESARPTRVRVSKPVASQYEEARAALRADEPNVLTRKSQEWADLTSGPRQGPVLAEARPVTDPAITEPVVEPATGTANAQPPRSSLPVRAAKATGRFVRGQASFMPRTGHPVRNPIIAAGAGALGYGVANRLRLSDAKPAGTTTGQVSGTQQTGTTPKGDTVPSGTKGFEDRRFPGVTLQGDPGDPASDRLPSASGAWDENGVYHNFPADMTDAEYEARMQEILHNQEVVATREAKAAQSAGTVSADEAATTPVDEPVQASGTAVPISTITGSDDTGTASAKSSGEPLLTSDGEDTGLVLNSDGSVSQKSGGNYGGGSGYTRKSYGGGSSYSRGSYSKRKKKKGSSSGFGSMFDDMFGEGFPFQRQNSPIRQLVLDAIANSLAEGQARKNAKKKS